MKQNFRSKIFNFVLGASLLIGARAGAQVQLAAISRNGNAPQDSGLTCVAKSPEMAQYLSQKNWRPYSLEDVEGAQPIPGFMDADGKFYFSELSRGGKFKATVDVSAANKDNTSFFKYCRASTQSSRKGLLRALRHTGQINQYALTFHFMPALTGLKNQPAVDQNLKFGRTELALKFDTDSVVEMGGEPYLDQFKTDLQTKLLKQIDAQKESGTIKLDLTGLDDVVCDVLMGKLKVAINMSASSLAPIVQLKKEVEPQDVNILYSQLKTDLATVVSKEELMFMSGRVTSQLEHAGRIATNSHKGSFGMVRKLLAPDLTRLMNFNASQLSCAIDQMQSYQRDTVYHSIGIQLVVPTLDEVVSQVVK